MSVWRLDLKNGDGEFTKGKVRIAATNLLEQN